MLNIEKFNFASYKKKKKRKFFFNHHIDDGMGNALQKNPSFYQFCKLL